MLGVSSPGSGCSGGRGADSTLVRSLAPPYNSGMSLKPGERAPDFTLVDTSGESVRLSELLGRPIVLVFLRWLG